MLLYDYVLHTQQQPCIVFVVETLNTDIPKKHSLPSVDQVHAMNVS